MPVTAPPVTRFPYDYSKETRRRKRRKHRCGSLPGLRFDEPGILVVSRLSPAGEYDAFDRHAARGAAGLSRGIVAVQGLYSCATRADRRSGNSLSAKLSLYKRYD